MNMNEIATAVRHNIPIIQVVVNNHVLGMVRQWQDLFYGQRYSATVLNDAVDFVKLAEAMGAAGFRATSREEFQETFARGTDNLVNLWLSIVRLIRMRRYGQWLHREPQSVKRSMNTI